MILSGGHVKTFSSRWGNEEHLGILVRGLTDEFVAIAKKNGSERKKNSKK